MTRTTRCLSAANPAQLAGYQKPLLAKHNGLVFTRQVWQGLNRGAWCPQCSSCHGCN